MSDYECFMAWLARTYPTHARAYSGDPVIQSAFFAGLVEQTRRNKVQEAIIERAMPLLRQIDADDPCDYGMEQQPMVYSVSKLLADIDGREWPPMQTANVEVTGPRRRDHA
jgi:hypothetical protein